MNNTISLLQCSVVSQLAAALFKKGMNFYTMTSNEDGIYFSFNKEDIYVFLEVDLDGGILVGYFSGENFPEVFEFTNMQIEQTVAKVYSILYGKEFKFDQKEEDEAMTKIQESLNAINVYFETQDEKE